MNLDDHQIADFNVHWNSTYLLCGKEVVQCHGIVAMGPPVKVKCTTEDGERLNPTLKELEILAPETGYYPYELEQYPAAALLTRLPRQQQVRGLCDRNAKVLFPKLGDMGVGWQNGLVANIVYSLNKPLVATPKESIQRLMSIKRKPPDKGELRYGRMSVSLPLTRDIAAVKAKYGFSLLLYRAIPIAHYVDGTVYLNKGAEMYKEQLNELRIGEVRCS